jgi:hypothetical protein
MAQWKSFLKRSKVSNVPTDLEEITGSIKAFLSPVLTHIKQGNEFGKTWNPKLGMWQ